MARLNELRSAAVVSPQLGYNPLTPVGQKRVKGCKMLIAKSASGLQSRQRRFDSDLSLHISTA